VVAFPALSCSVPETLILAYARKALFLPTQFLALNLHIEFGKVKVRKRDNQVVFRVDLTITSKA